MKVWKTWLMFPSIWLGVVIGCGGPGAHLPAQQMVAQAESKGKHNSLQEQLLKQVARLSAVDFKDYLVGPEDLLQINCLNTDKLNGQFRVNGQGEISPLLVGVVKVAGLTPIEIEKKLARLYLEGDYLTNPQFAVSVMEFRHQKVAVTGAVNKPDHYALIGPRTLLEVLGMAGGLSDKAGEVAHIIRSQKGSSTSRAPDPNQSFSPGTETVIVNLNRLLLKGDVQLNYTLQNGDVVYVPFAEIAYVLGSVNKPGEIVLRKNMTVAKAVAEAGGLHLALSSNKATILRVDENGQRQNIPVDISQVTKGSAEDLLLKESDIVYVHESGVRRFLFDLKLFNPGAIGMGVPAML